MNKGTVATAMLCPHHIYRRQGVKKPGGLLPEKLGGGVWPASQNPYTIYIQQHSTRVYCTNTNAAI